MAIIELIGCRTESEKLIYTSLAIFAAQFFNTALLITIVNANFSNSSYQILRWLCEGNDPDFNQRWFVVVGNVITGSMFANIFMPLIEAIVSYVSLESLRCKDRGCSRKKNSLYATQTTTVPGYIDLYAGPSYQMHFKYSMILNIIYVTMMYGVGMPVLFYYALVSFICLYLVEKFMLYYGYRKPPQYDVVLNNYVLGVMKGAPMVLLSFGYWFLPNKQLLSNKYLKPKHRKSIPYDATHDPIDTIMHPSLAITDSPGAGALLVLLMFYLIFIIIPLCCQKRKFYLLNICNRKNKYFSDDIVLDETIDTYYKCLDDDDRQWTIKEESYYRDTFDLEIMLDETVKKLKNNKLSK